MIKTPVENIISIETRKNKKLASAMLDNFSTSTRSALSPEFLNSVEQTIARHLENFLDPLSAIAVSANITESLRGEITDMINDTQDEAIRLVEQYTSHFSMQIKNAIKKYNQQVCWCEDCHPHHKKGE